MVIQSRFLREEAWQLGTTDGKESGRPAHRERTAAAVALCSLYVKKHGRPKTGAAAAAATAGRYFTSIFFTHGTSMQLVVLDAF